MFRPEGADCVCFRTGHQKNCNSKQWATSSFNSWPKLCATTLLSPKYSHTRCTFLNQAPPLLSHFSFFVIISFVRSCWPWVLSGERMESGTFENEGRPDLGGLDASGDHGTSSALSGEVNGHGHGEHGRGGASLALDALLRASNDIEATRRTREKIRGHFALGAWICDVSGC